MQHLSWRTVSLALAVVSISAFASIRLDIPPRKQWTNKSGYCGEVCIQQIALYYGAYISQYRIREIIDPTQAQDVWVPENSGPIFKALKFATRTWDSTLATPQYKAYLVWIKGHLQQGHPVIFDVFVQGESDPAYDHIMLATGFTAANAAAYDPADSLIFTDGYWSRPYSRLFGSLHDTRAMSGNGAVYEYCIPKRVDRGCAVLGFKDLSGTALPVSMKIDRWDEPNVTQGAWPAELNATIRVGGLKAGNSYALLRYDDYRRVPKNNYLASAFDRKTVFTASSGSASFSDTVRSDGMAIYRCVPVP
jgi:hypothetical protein